MSDPYHRFGLAAFESLDPEGEDRAEVGSMTAELELEILSAVTSKPDEVGIEEAVEALNRQGHRFEKRETNPGWASYFQQTNDDTRDFWIHVNREDDDVSVMVLYFEKLEVTRARALSEMSEEERAEAELVDSFYDRGSELVTNHPDERTIPDEQRLLYTLYLLDTGVNNGGFDTYIANTEGKHLTDIVAFLREVGATQHEAIVREVLHLLPSDLGSGLTPIAWQALDEKRAALDELDGRYYSSDENLALLTMTFLGEEKPG